MVNIFSRNVYKKVFIALFMVSEKYDLVIIGAGGAGLAGGMYGARLGLKTLILGASHGSELPIGGVITTTNIVENYPGFIKLSGPEIADELRKHAESYELVSIKEEKAIEVKKDKTLFLITGESNKYVAKAIIFATGTKWRKLPNNVKGGQEFENRGVAYCALCDAPLFKNKIVCVVGGSDSAVKDALVLAEHAKKVYIIYRGEKVRAEPINFQRMESNNKIEVVNNANIVEVSGDKVVKKIM